MQLRLRESCVLPAQSAWSPLLWHVVQTALASRGVIFGNRLMCPLLSSSTCALPGPWQDSHPCCGAGVRGSDATPCLVPFSVWVWQVVQVSSPTYSLDGGGCGVCAAGMADRPGVVTGAE